MIYPNIEAERGRNGKSKQELSHLLGISPNTLLNWQTGKTQIPTNKLLLMCDLFHCSADYLLGRQVNRDISPQNPA